PLAAWYVNSVFWPSGNERDTDLRRHAGQESEIRVRSGDDHAVGPAWTDLADLAGEAATRQRVDGKGGAHSRPQCLHVIERHLDPDALQVGRDREERRRLRSRRHSLSDV